MNTHQRYVLNLENCVLTYVADTQAPNADATLTLTRATLDDISLQNTTLQAALQSGRITAAGPREKLDEMLAMLDTLPPGFPMVEPRPAR
jgi:alkyl sulfatase BDS1-like metallo-beta-lactamase superfamily hydrolase